MNFIEAISTIAAGTIYKIVVDTPETASLILKHDLIYGIKRILPLSKLKTFGFGNYANKIKQKNDNYHGQPNDIVVISEARALVKNIPDASVHLPHELIDYKDTDKKIIDFVFQNYLVVNSMDVGRVIIEKMGIRCVTHQGEKIEKGQLSGGFVGNRENILKEAYNYMDKKRKLLNLKNKLSKLDANRKEIENLQIKIKKYEKNIDLSEQQIEHNKKNFSEDQYLKYEREKEEINRFINELSSDKEKLENLLIEKEKELNNMTNSNDNGFSINKKYEEYQETLKNINKINDNLEQEMIKLSTYLENYQKEKENNETKISELEQMKQALKYSINEKESNLEHLKKQMKEFNQENQNFLNKIKKLENEKFRFEKSCKQLEDEIASIEREININSKNTNDILNDLNNKKKTKEKVDRRNFEDYEKLPENFDHSLINLTNTSMNESFVNIQHKKEIIEKRIYELKETINKLQTKISEECETLLIKLQHDVEDIKDNQQIISNNRNHIIKDISNLNVKKIFSVRKCFEKVNQNLAHMFTSLVPNASAKMELKNYPLGSNEKDTIAEENQGKS